MKREYDFSKGVRGKFYKKNQELLIPIYLEPKIQERMEDIANKTGKDISLLVNNLIKHNLKIAESIQ